MADFDGFLSLAAEVEHLFGKMVAEQGFHNALTLHLSRSSALVAEQPGAGKSGAGRSGIAGGLMFDPGGPKYHVDWLVVSEQVRGTGVGRALMDSAMEHFVRGPGTIEVVTFGPGHPGAAARDFYAGLGFAAGLMTWPGPEGGSRQIYTKSLPA
jgi:GNAT superfamily N-acetyltransferase